MRIRPHRFSRARLLAGARTCLGRVVQVISVPSTHSHGGTRGAAADQIAADQIGH
jgi:hypothetical protein